MTAPRAAAAAIGLVRAYGEGRGAVRALDGITMWLPAGRFTAVMGPSGSGKSTLLHCLAGLDRPTAGQVLLGDTDLGALDDADLTVVRRDRIGFVFQDGNLLPHLTAGENIDLAASLAGRRPDRAWRTELVDRLGIGDRLRHVPAELSGGQRQRVAVARALLGRPEIVVADEPTGALDTTSGRELLGLLRGCVDDYGQTVVMVTHDPLAASASDQVLLLRDGTAAGRLADPTPGTVLTALGELTAGGRRPAPVPS
ncbi:peptide ABC transporter ATP-binding protein [Pseudonocardia sp. EC080610-09]|uniref:ABC transporter ATP-binding protein n=1 Tax=unclassified Pseudonocardia TaxID=2619320 RepID=UPI0006CB43F4|nr:MULTISPECIES: ABC transporter ATP-binding protein [unclassified Pseudonocardia]ALE71975.1 peptide ABC transporter ATP-binding protein [Pseudonocardia sp. EC080625-04]ALL75248.1 peptide ABC transporter ATP-binding protein [Pseudonocardia sp. EC080610-09]ALL82274.1 peptide ABC transporter ATP-binding protein [Pseudonocardia sp. EC080619-01]